MAKIDEFDFPWSCPNCYEGVNPISRGVGLRGKQVNLRWECEKCGYHWQEIYQFYRWIEKEDWGKFLPWKDNSNVPL